MGLMRIPHQGALIHDFYDRPSQCGNCYSKEMCHVNIANICLLTTLSLGKLKVTNCIDKYLTTISF